eukprot:1166197_1
MSPTLHLSQCYSSKAKKKSKSTSKPKQKSANTSTPSFDDDPLYKAPSLRDYANTSNKKSIESGWNGCFHNCYRLVNHNPDGITKMMHQFNVISTTVGVGLFGAIYFCSFHSIYCFPGSWLFSWIVLRLFTDIFPIFPKLYIKLIESHAWTTFPVLKHLTFSRKMPNPQLQSFSSMFNDRLGDEQKTHYKKKILKQRKEEHLDIENIEITDELMQNSSPMVSWKIRSRANAKKYGIAWDMVENSATLIMMPTFMCLFQMVGIGDPLIGALLQNDNVISGFLTTHNWIIKFGTSYAVATYLNRIIAIPVFKHWCVPRAYEKFGPY